MCRSQTIAHLTPDGCESGRHALPAAIVEVFDIGRAPRDLWDERKRSPIHGVPNSVVGAGGNQLHPGACHTEFIRFEGT